MAKTADRDVLLRLLQPVVNERGLDLEDVSVTPAGRRRMLRVVVDRDGGLELDAVADVSSAVSAALDDAEAMGGAPYVLEVTSPGVDRPLTEPRHWRRARTRLVRAALTDGTTATGRVTEVDADAVTLQDPAGSTTRLAWERIATGRVQVEFNRRGATQPTDGAEKG